MSETVRLDEIPTVPDTEIPHDWQPGQTDRQWQPIPLHDDQYAIPPEPPETAGLLYRGKRHVISGAPESAKTLLVYGILLQALRDGHPFAVLDFEMGATGTRRLLDDLGATREELAAIYYVEPDRPPTPDDIAAIIQHGAHYVLIDAAAGAYDATGLDDNQRKDVETFARKWIRPLHAAGVATIVIDHVTKNAETRGKFAIGSERKGGQADVHLGLEAVKTLTRGGTGIVKVTVHKDRPGYLQRPTAAICDLHSDPDTHHVTWTLKPYANEADPDSGEFRPTALMEKVSRHLELHPEGQSRKDVETSIGGRAKWVRIAMDILVREHFLAETPGARGAKLMSTLKPYRKPDPVTNPEPDHDLVPPRPAHEQATSETDGSAHEASNRVTNPQNGDSDPISPRPTSSHLVPDEVNPHRPTSSPSTEGTGRGDEPLELNLVPDEDDDFPF